MTHVLVGIPVYNEQQYVARVLGQVHRYASDVLVIDDGSTDETPMLLAQQRVEVIRHAENRGYGRSMQDMLRWAEFDGFDWLITMDCDEQHEPAAIPRFVEAIERDDADVISGSRYLEQMPLDDAPPDDRRRNGPGFPMARPAMRGSAPSRTWPMPHLPENGRSAHADAAAPRPPPRSAAYP